MAYMDLQKYMYDLGLKDIKEALEVCVGILENEGIKK